MQLLLMLNHFRYKSLFTFYKYGENVLLIMLFLYFIQGKSNKVLRPSFKVSNVESDRSLVAGGSDVANETQTVKPLKIYMVSVWSFFIFKFLFILFIYLCLLFISLQDDLLLQKNLCLTKQNRTKKWRKRQQRKSSQKSPLNQKAHPFLSQSTMLLVTTSLT